MLLTLKSYILLNKLVLTYSLSTIILIIGALGSAHIYEGCILYHHIKQYDKTRQLYFHQQLS